MIRAFWEWLTGGRMFGYPRHVRLIFRFFDGRRQWKADPLAVHRALSTDPDFDLDLDPKLADQPTKVGLEAQGRVAAAVRRAFGLVPFDQGGLTDAECLELFVSFGAYLTGLEEQARPLLNSPTPTDSAAPASG